MRLRVRHQTRYLYNGPVELGPHTLRMSPRADGSQWLHSFRLDVDPEPTLRTQHLDAEGNTVTQVWFDGTTSHLRVDVDFEVETTRDNPHDFLLTEEAVARLPAHYHGSLADTLSVCRAGEEVNWPVREFAASVAVEADNETLRFLPRLSRRIAEHCDREVRTMGPPREAAETLQRRQGSSRDLTVLFIEACRALGLAARFVSGYQRGNDHWETHQMHAWAEVYLPGGGWRGYDPAHGLAAGETLVSVAAAASPVLTAPVTGWYRGDNITQRLEFDLTVS